MIIALALRMNAQNRSFSEGQHEQCLRQDLMRFRYVIKDVHGNHFEFEPREHNLRNIRECLEHAESKLNGSFSGGEVVSIKRLFKGKEKHEPIPQDHKPREIGAPKCRCYINAKTYAKQAAKGGSLTGYKPCPIHEDKPSD